MHALQALGFALGADAPAALESELITRRVGGNVNIQAIQGSGRTGLATDAGHGVVVTSSGDVVQPGSIAAQHGGMVSGSGLFGIPWLWVGGGVLALGAAWIVMKKKRAPTLSDFASLAGFGRKRRRRRHLRG